MQEQKSLSDAIRCLILHTSKYSSDRSKGEWLKKKKRKTYDQYWLLKN